MDLIGNNPEDKYKATLALYNENGVLLHEVFIEKNKNDPDSISLQYDLPKNGTYYLFFGDFKSGKLDIPLKYHLTTKVTLLDKPSEEYNPEVNLDKEKMKLDSKVKIRNEKKETYLNISGTSEKFIEFAVNFEENIDLLLFDVSGKLIANLYKGTPNKKERIRIELKSNLFPNGKGIYVVKLIGNSVLHSQKFFR